MDYIKKNLHELLAEIKEISGDRRVTLVAVTKSGTDEELLELVRCGATDIGENRPQELVRRGAILEDNGLDVRLHEIGNLQRNKVKSIIEKVALIHSVDSLSLAAEIDKQAGKVGRRVDILIEINSAREESKGGVSPEEATDLFLKVRELPNVRVRGLMTMGNVCEDPEDIRPCFRLVRELFDKINATYGFEGEPILSMGMSDSYRVAISEGATLVRVGRRLFQK